MNSPALIRSKRLDKGLTIRKAAKEIGVTADILLRAENGATPRPEAALKIAEFCGVAVTTIWPVDSKPPVKARVA